MADEVYTELPPPSADKVARRAIILSVVCCRGFTEGKKDDPEGVNLARNSLEWLVGLDISEDWSDWERRILMAPLGTVNQRDRWDASWLIEAVIVLAWALGKADLPAFDQQCDPPDVANSLGFLDQKELTVLENPALRSITELMEYDEFLYNLHWRLRDFSINRRPYDFEQLAEKAWGTPIHRHGLRLIDKDIAVGDIPISRSAEVDWRTLSSITSERHRASNWLIGYASEDFYEVTTDT